MVERGIYIEASKTRWRASGVFCRLITQQAQLNINHASVAEAAKIYYSLKTELKRKLLYA